MRIGIQLYYFRNREESNDSDQANNSFASTSNPTLSSVENKFEFNFNDLAVLTNNILNTFNNNLAEPTMANNNNIIITGKNPFEGHKNIWNDSEPTGEIESIQKEKPLNASNEMPSQIDQGAKPSPLKSGKVYNSTSSAILQVIENENEKLPTISTSFRTIDDLQTRSKTSDNSEEICLVENISTENPERSLLHDNGEMTPVKIVKRPPVRDIYKNPWA